MANVKQDLMKEIEAKIARKKVVASQASRQKTVVSWVADFFAEHEKTKNLDRDTAYMFSALALNRLRIQLRGLDGRCHADFREAEDGSGLVVEIRWSASFSQTNNCEQVLVFDASSAFFQSAMEDI